MTCFGFVSTYPPTLCGLATFTSALHAELATSGGGSGRVVRVVDAPQRRGPAEVVGELIAGEPSSIRRAAHLLDDSDVAIVQHEYGAYGGADGDEILPLLAAVGVPTVVVLHTVLSAPTSHHRSVVEQVAPAVRGGHAPSFRTAQPTILTWGLLGPGKGIEWGIEAMTLLTDLQPAPRYIVAGQTHPKVLSREGEAYRGRLIEQVHRLALTASVSCDSHYRHEAALIELVDSADVVLLPYDSTDQVTSGVLIEAVAALKPVIATRFPHAVELLGSGAGLLVPHKNPAAIATALRTLLTRRAVASEIAKAAAATAPELLWPAVAARYRDLAERLIRDRAAA